MTSPLTLAQAHARWVQAKMALLSAVSLPSQLRPETDAFWKIEDEAHAAEAALLAMPSAPQEPPQAPFGWRLKLEALRVLIAEARTYKWAPSSGAECRDLADAIEQIIGTGEAR